MLAVAMPMVAQDCMEVYFNDGTRRKFFLRNLEDITVSKYDAAGVSHSDFIFQQVVTKDGKYVYNINDIDSITFTKYPEEVVEHNVASSLSTIFPALDNCKTIDDIEGKIELIKNSEGVEDAWINGNELCVKIKDWGTMGFRLNNEEDEEDDDDSFDSRFMEQMPSILSIFKNAVNTKPSLKVAIANHTKYDERHAYTKIEKRFKKIEDLFKSIGITPDIVEPSMDFFRSTMFEKDIVILCTHGTIRIDNNNYFIFDENGDYIHQLYASDPLGSIKKSKDDIPDEVINKWKDVLIDLVHKKGYNDDFFASSDIQIDWLQEERDGEDTWIAYPKLSENFIIEACKDKKFENANSILFASVCRTLFKSDSFARKLHEKKNLGSYYGYDGTVLTGRASNSALHFFQSLLSGNSIEKSIGNIPDKCKKDIWSEQGQTTVFVPIYNSHEKDFLFPAITNQVDSTVAINCFNTHNYVEVEGLTLTLDLNTISCGFEYGPKYGSPWKRIVSTDTESLSTTIDKGNVLFKARLKDLEPGQTYCYCAYTYDGMYYNYGNPCEFTLSEPVESTCPARITNVEFKGAEYHQSEERQNQMLYTVTATLDDMTDIEEWGLYYDYSTNKSEFPFESVNNEQSKNMRYSTATSGLGKTTTKLIVDFNSYVAELSDEVGVYVKKRDKATGELKTIYGEKVPFTLRYDTKPSLVFSDPTIRETTVIGTKNGHKQYQTVVAYNYAAKGAFWMNYSIYKVVGNNWDDLGSSKMYFEKDEYGGLTSTEKYWDYSNLGHSAYEVIYLRNSQKTYSNCLNFSGSNGIIDNVWVSSSPAYSARQMESNPSGNEIVNYVILNTPTEDVNVKARKVIKQVPYGGGYLEEIAY